MNVIKNMNFKINGNIKYSSLNDKLAFEGEYINGEENEKGKKYSKEFKIIFDDIFKIEKDGMESRKFHLKKELNFEFKYLNDDIHGISKEYSIYRELLFEFRLLHGKKLIKY